MQCLYCGKALGLLRELSEREFCSHEHQRQYKKMTQLAFSRLFEAPTEAAQPDLAEGAARRESLFLRPALPKFGFTDGQAVCGSTMDSQQRPQYQLGPLPMDGSRTVQRVYDTPALAGGEQPQASPALRQAGAWVLPLPAPAPAAIDSSRDLSSLRPTFRSATVQALPRHVLESASAGLALQVAVESPVPVLAAPAQACPSFQVQPAAFHMPQAGKLPVNLQLRTVDLPLVALSGALSSKPSLDPIQSQLQPVDIASTTLREAASVELSFGGRLCLPVHCGDSGFPVGSPLARALPQLPAAAAAPVCSLVSPSLVPVQVQEVPVAGQMLAEAVPLACAAPAVRRLKLQIAADKLTLRAEEKMTEKFSGADLLAVPLSASVSPNLEPASSLPALASLFRLGGGARAVTPQPHLSDRLAPIDRLRVPVAFMEIPMPALRPVVPRNSSLRIMETFEYVRPMEEQQLDIVQSFLNFWRATPAYLRYATASFAVLTMLWVGAPVSRVNNLVSTRWSRVQAGMRGRAAVEMSEDFQDGMQGWQGQGEWTRSWQINKAGYARPGRLALYEPSMHMQDYRMEFLVQIEKKAVGWAYRAGDTENYYAAKITVVKPGPLPVLSLVRYPVIGGRQGEKVEIPIRILMHNDTPYRVQLTVNGQEFSTSIEGQLVDLWRDDKLKAGGFGFFSDTGERARVYWMKLSHQDDFIGRVCAYFGPVDVDKGKDSRSF
jgi:hypothetical protein